MKHLTEKSNALKLFNKLNEGVDKTAQAKEIMASLGINEIYFSDEHKPNREYDTRIPNAYKYVTFYGYAYVNHDTLGNFYISYKVSGRDNIIDASGFPWEGIEKDTTEEQKAFIENNYEALSELFILCKGQVGVSLNESTEPSDIEYDSNGLPALDAPYYMNWYEPSEYYYIRSAHPYDNTDYSFAKSAGDDFLGSWYVYTPEGKLAGNVEGYEEAVKLMKEIDSKLEARIDRT